MFFFLLLTVISYLLPANYRNTAYDIWVTTLLVYMHPTTSVVANTRLHDGLVLHFTTLLQHCRLCELYVRMPGRWIPGEIALYWAFHNVLRDYKYL
jgi:hypothetical protein